MRVLHERDDVIRNFGNALTEKGLTFQVCFEQILGITNAADAEISQDQLEQCFQLMGFAYGIKKIDKFMKAME